MLWLALAALLAGAVQTYFAHLELRKWDEDFVTKQTVDWDEPIERYLGQPINLHNLAKLRKLSIEWASPLAKNLGAYNLLVALALFWTAAIAWVESSTAPHLGLLLGLFLIGAALAALKTGVPRAFKAQGTLGLLLVIAALI